MAEPPNPNHPIRFKSTPRQAYGRWWPYMTALTVIVVELCWVVPWFRTLIQISHVASPLRASLVLGAVMVTGYLLAQMMESIRLHSNVQLAVLGIAFFICLVGSSFLLLETRLLQVTNGLARLDPGEVLVVFFVLWTWWRGAALGHNTIQPLTAWRRFEFGLLMLLAHTLIVARMDESVLEQAPGIGLFVFFLFVGLLSVILARISYVSIAHGLQKNPFDRRWLGTTTGVLGLTVGVATILGGLLSGQYTMVLDFLAEAFRLTVAVIIFVYSLPWLYLSRFLSPLIPYLRQLVGTPTPTEKSPYPLDPNFLPALKTAPQPQPLSPEVVSFIFWGVILLLIVMILVNVRRRLLRSVKEDRDEQESLLAKGEARKLMRKAFQDAAQGLAARLRPAARLRAAAYIRRIYAQLLALSSELNHPRLDSQTPFEFEDTLRELFSSYRAEINLITNAYIRVRYGELPETEQEIIDLESAWKRVSVEGDRLKSSGQYKLTEAKVEETQRTRA
jgi:hypothetical protein